jgi:hypothetical protein
LRTSFRGGAGGRRVFSEPVRAVRPAALGLPQNRIIINDLAPVTDLKRQQRTNELVQDMQVMLITAIDLSEKLPAARLRPKTATVEDLDAWRAMIEKTVSLREAHAASRFGERLAQAI